ncbi:hypothetical protein VMCG_08642 [Cytospora schulzeri]|uniref:Uncharacterized protein n=1 Tax=Cytospora schulzeri TaxID=448051 RepID=A0A423VTJ9_9PEZI|nr:hypothetical protein VMCG_08642 [Valsa malicola]
MDEPCWAWPFWKFGLKSDDLNTTLHDRFNTVPSAIQDPEAFHHDVYELSTQACTLDEFERLMEERKQLRLKELNSMLEDASFEIVGNPSLIGTEQWQYALQLFRTKSLDSLVRYFASYLPQDHPWHHDFDSSVSSNHGYSSVLDCHGPVMFDEPEEDDDPFTNETSHPCTSRGVSSNQPARSMTVRSEDSGVSVTDRDHKFHSNHTSERPMSFFESEPGQATTSPKSSIPSLHDYEGTSQSDDPETPSTSISDLSDADESHGKEMLETTVTDDDEYVSISHVQSQTIDPFESEAPTPKPQPVGSATDHPTPFLDTKLSSLRSPGLSSNYSHPHHAYNAHQHYRKDHSTARQLRRRICGLERKRRYGLRGIPGPHKVLSRSRDRGRRHVGV